MYEVLEHGTATAVFIDSSAIVAYLSPNDQHHEAVAAFFEGVRDGDLRARPLYTSEYVVDEAATTLLARAGHDRASHAVAFLRASGHLQVEHVDEAVFEATAEQFRAFDDHGLSFTDHAIAIQARERGVGYVLSFDQGFEALGLTTLPG